MTSTFSYGKIVIRGLGIDPDLILKLKLMENIMAKNREFISYTTYPTEEFLKTKGYYNISNLDIKLSNKKTTLPTKVFVCTFTADHKAVKG